MAKAKAEKAAAAKSSGTLAKGDAVKHGDRDGVIEHIRAATAQATVRYADGQVAGVPLRELVRA